MTAAIILTALAAAPLELPANAVASGPVVTAGDLFTSEQLAAAFGTDAGDVAAVMIAPAPADGRVAPIAAADVAARLRSHLARHGSELVGPPRVVVRSDSAAVIAPRPAAATVAPGRTRLTRRLETLARDYLAAAAPELGRVTLAVELTDDAVRAWPHGDDLILTGGTAPYTGPQTFRVRDRQAGPETPIRVRVEQQPFRLAAAHDLPRGTVLAARDLVWTQKPGGTADPEELVGKQLTRSLRGGEPIAPEAVESVPLVKANNVVSAVIRRPGLAVRRLMRARGEGARGDFVPLSPLEGGRDRLVGRVVGFQEVEVVTAGGPTTGGFR